MSKKNILFVLDHFTPFVGGAEILFENLTQRLIKKGYTVTILTTHHDRMLAKYEVLDDGRIIYRKCSNRYIFILGSIFTAIRLARFCDIIHTTTYSGAIPARIAGWIQRKPVIITVHEVFHNLWYRFMGWKGFFYKAFEQIILALPFTAYICVSDYTRNSLRLVYTFMDEKLYTVYNGINTEIFHKGKIARSDIQKLQEQYRVQGKKSVLFYGRPGVSKGLEYLVNAIPIVMKQIPDIQFLLIIGNEPRVRRESILKTISHLDIQNNIQVIKPQKTEQLRTFIASSSLAVVPSLAEGFGFAAAEICTLGTPLLTTNAGALPEVVSGVFKIVDSGNATALANGIIEFFRYGYSETPQKYFSWEENVNRTMDIYSRYL